MSNTSPTRRDVTEPNGAPLPHYGQEEERLPDRIGSFRILALVAKGMALVYKAEQDRPQRVVALKMPRGGQLASPEARRRFQQEIGLAAKIEHAGIVPVLEAGEIDGLPYYTMPFIEGLSLTAHLETHRPDGERRLDLFLRVCEVAQTLHAVRLVHRDLKPDNIMIDTHGDVRLLDFGLARACEEGSPRFTLELLGTLQFMAPEQAEPSAARPPTPATDVYALGVMLYWLLTDVYPYAVVGSRSEALLAVLRTAPEPPSKNRPGLSTAWDAVTLKALRKEPAERYQTAGELAEAVRAVRQPVSNYAPTVAMTEPFPPHPPRRTAGGHTAATRRWRRVGVGLTIGGVLLAGLGLALGWFQRSAPGSAVPDPRRLVARVNEMDRVSNPPSAPVGTLARSNETHVLPRPPRRTAGDETERPVPVELWSAYEKARTALREDFAHRRQGVVLLRPAENLRAAPLRLTWQMEGDAEPREATVEPGDVGTLFLPADRICRIEAQIGGHVVRRSVTVAEGQVTWATLP
ncbi:MAG: serine/threonine protein kinase [Lentisphaerae bacterium]|nr:serine/threonine protein kinase [Lentisphaerota bacterium]